MKENLYHFTSTAYLPNILINGLRFHKIDMINFEYQYYISTTRFFDFHFFNRRMRITLDKNEIRKNFKMMPIHFKNWQGIKSKYNIIDNRIKGHNDMMNQFEERIVLNPTNGKYFIKDAFYLPVKYIKQIDIINPIGVPPKTIEEISKLDNPHNIKINIVDNYKPIKEMKHIKTYQQIFENKQDRNGNYIGDGKYHTNYNIFDFTEYPNIYIDISKSDTTESVYVTYINNDNDKKITVRFSEHENNAVKFGDQLDGLFATKDEVLYHLGLKSRIFIPLKKKFISTRKVSHKDISNNIYKEADKTIQELYNMEVGTDISQYKNKLARNSNYLILADKIEELEITGRDFLGRDTVKGDYIYK